MSYQNFINKLGPKAAQLKKVVEKMRKEDLEGLDDTIKDRVDTKLGELETELQTFADEAAAGAIDSALEAGGDIDVAIDEAVNGAIEALEVITFVDPGDLVSDVTVANGTTEADAIAQLPDTVTITGGTGDTEIVDVTWTIEGYDSTTAGTYPATGTFTFPHLWTGTPEVYADVIVED